MKKTLKLETISFKNRRARFEGNIWLTVSPVINLDELKFGQPYTLDIVMDNMNRWYVDSFSVPEETK